MKALLLAGVSALALTAGAAFAGQNTFPMVVRSTHNAVHFTPRNGSTVLYDQVNSSGFSPYAVLSSVFESSAYGTYDSAGADDFVIPGTAEHHITAVYAPGQNAYGSDYIASKYDVIFYKKIKRRGNRTEVKVLASCPSSPRSRLVPQVINVSSCGVKVRGSRDYSISLQAITPAGDNEVWYWQTNRKQIGTEAWWTNYGGGFDQCISGYEPIKGCFPTSGIGPDFAFELFGK